MEGKLRKTGTDIIAESTRRKRAEEQVREERDKAQKYLDIAEVVLVVINADQKVSLINKKGCQILECEEEEIIGKNWFDTFIPKRNREEVKMVFKKLMAGEIEPVEYFENPVLTRSGEERLIAWHNAILADDAGNIMGTLSSGEDITERRQAEEALRKSEEKLRLMFESVTDGITVTDLDGVIAEVNERVVEMHGFSSRDKVLGRSAFELIVQRDREKAMDNMQKTLEKGSVEGIEYRLLKADGSEFPGELSASILKDHSGNPVGFIAVTRDITERKRMEEELHKAAKLESLGTLAGGIAHDFNNILAGILNNISLAKTYVDPGGEVFGILQEAENASLRATHLTQQLLTFARGGAPIKRITSLEELIKDSASFALRGSNVRCEFSLADDIWRVEVDEGQISQVITNLIINADEAMPDGGVVKIQAQNTTITAGDALPLSEGNYVKITVEDHGAGIPEQRLAQIFDPYFSTKPKESGLGLTTSYSTVRKHSGHITVKSKLGVGTTFHVYLPASEKPVPKKKTAVEPFIVGKGKLLVMEDEEIIRKPLRRMLTDVGYEVELATEGAEAVKRYAKAKETGQPFDAVILDLTVPGGMGGKETIRKLLEIDPSVKVIASSGYSTDPIMAKFREYGFKGAVAKPYRIEELKETLRKVIKMSRAV